MSNLFGWCLAAVLALQTAAPAPAFAQRSVGAPRAVLCLQIADTQIKREYGLMNRLFLRRHHGMVFVFSQDAPVTFWMKNTLIPLDMVFISGTGRVRSIAVSVPSSTLQSPDEQIARRTGRAKYVLELNAGEAATDGLAPGVLVSGLAELKAAAN